MSNPETEEVNATPTAIELAEEEGVDLSEVKGSGEEGRILVDDVRDYIRERDGDEEEVYEVDQEVEDLGFEEVPPLIKAGSWVRLRAGAGLDDKYINRDCAVVRAVTRTTTGPSTLSNDKVEYQLPTDPILVRVRDTGEEFEVAVGNVEVAVDERSRFGGR